MWLTLAVGFLLFSATFAYLRYSRVQLYKALESGTSAVSEPAFSNVLNSRSQERLPSFDTRLVHLDDVLPTDQFAALRSEIEALVDTERSYLPAHKKGGTVAYETLMVKAPRVVTLYRSPALSQLVSSILGETARPTPINDQSSCSILFYDRPGDHIGWHYDHNFYLGRHVTVLIPIINRNATGDGLSAARLEARFGTQIDVIDTPPNRFVMFEGQKVLHRVTPIAAGERRVMLSMTFATDTRSSIAQGIKRRIKDTAFFGLRALWT